MNFQFVPTGSFQGHSFLLLVAGLVALSACEPIAIEEGTLSEVEVIDGVHQSNNIVDLGGSCYREDYQQPDAVLSDKLDLLFVLDTSGSLRTERHEIAGKIEDYLKELPARVHYRVAVLLAHGQRSTWSGKLFYKGLITPRVFESHKHSNTWIRKNLQFRLSLSPMDYFTDGGETAFHSLYRATSGDKLKKNQKSGFFRDDAALSVIFISDENEICAAYPDGVTPVEDYNRHNGKTLEEIAREENCTVKDESGQEHWLSPDFMLEHLRTLKGSQPLSIGAIIHTDKNAKNYTENSRSHFYRHRNPLLRNRSRRHFAKDEDEFGYGYAELVELSNGEMIDVHSENFSEGMTQLGTKTAQKMQVYDTFQLTYSDVISNSIEASVDGQSTDVELFDSLSNTVHLSNPGIANSLVSIDYCIETDNNGCLLYTSDAADE